LLEILKIESLSSIDAKHLFKNCLMTQSNALLTLNENLELFKYKAHIEHYLVY